MDRLSQQYVNIPQRRFPIPVVAEVLSYKPVLKSTRVSQGVSELAFLKLQKNLKHFYNDTGCKLFFKENLKDYNKMTANFVANHCFDYTGRLKEFFGTTMDKAKFETILSPMYRGAEAVVVTNSDNTKTYISIVNPLNIREDWLMSTIIHEATHNFLEPVFLKQQTLLQEYQPFLEASIGQANGIIKNDYRSFLNEMLARAVTIILTERYQSPEMANAIWLYEKENGWVNLDEVCALIKNKYLTKREKYSTFESFFPEILEFFKAKSTGHSIDVGPGFLVEAAIQEGRVLNIYWPGDPQIQEIKQNQPYCFMIELEYLPLQYSFTGKAIGDFVRKAGLEFELIAEGEPRIKARICEGGMCQIATKQIYYFWVALAEAEFGKLKPGVEYRLNPLPQNGEVRWNIPEGKTVILPKKQE